MTTEPSAEQGGEVGQEKSNKSKKLKIATSWGIVEVEQAEKVENSGVPALCALSLVLSVLVLRGQKKLNKLKKLKIATSWGNEEVEQAEKVENSGVPVP